MELNEQNQNMSETNTNLHQKISKVSAPIHTQTNGFYRYNYERERLEFINNEKVIAFFREIPLDQWENLPSQADYCRNITEQATEQLRSEKKIGLNFFLLIFITPVLLIFVMVKFFNNAPPVIIALVFMTGLAIPVLLMVKMASKK